MDQRLVNYYLPDRGRFYAMSPDKQERLFDRHQALCDAVSADVAGLVVAMGDYGSILQTFTLKHQRRRVSLAAMAFSVLAAVAAAAFLPASWSPLLTVLMLIATGAAGVCFTFNRNNAVRANETSVARRMATELFDEYAVILHVITEHGVQARPAGHWLAEATGHAKTGRLHPALHRAQALLDGWVAEDAERNTARGEDSGTPLPPYATGP